MKLAKGLRDPSELQVVPFDPQKAKRQIKALQTKVAQLQEHLLLKDGQLAQLHRDYESLSLQAGRALAGIEFRLKDDAKVAERFEAQVERFEQLMSKLFRKERRQTLVEEIEKLDSGESL